MRVLRWIVATTFTLACAFGLVVVLSAYDEMTAALPPIDRLLNYDPPVATRVFAADGTLAEEFFRERRYLVPVSRIPPVVRKAFLAAEDAGFYSHHGIDVLGIGRAFAANLRAGDVVQGGSTITQQVVKALLLSPERSYERKIKELLLALRLEQQLTKDQILELYLNQIYLGDGNHGIGAAARNYFGKSVDELSVAQAAMLAGLPAAPSRYAPTRDLGAATTRQHYVLRRMLEEGFISAGDYQGALREGLHVVPRTQRPDSVRNYYTEAVRLQLEDMFGAEAPYNQGYSVTTSMDTHLQSLADAAIRNGIERLDLAYGYRGPIGHLDSAARDTRIAKDTADASLATLDRERLYQAVVTAVSPTRLQVAVGPHNGAVDVSALRWNSKAKNRLFRSGDLIEVRTRAPGTARPRGAISAKAEVAGADGGRDDGAAAAPGTLFLAQSPEIEAALVAIDLHDGGLSAMVGGYDFLGSQFNRATQAKRQPGSAFKPFVYAAALDNGFTAASILRDEPVEYMDHGRLWQPRNYTRDYKGPMRLRTALEQSRNVVSVKLVDSVGVKTVVDYLERFRFDTKFGPNLSIALGTTELTLLDLTAGFTTFANAGVKVEPSVIRSIADKDGRPFFENEARKREVLSPQTASLMTYILEGVIERGTATRVKALGRPVAGKTGTTNEQRDAWFIGYTPDLAVGVWVGFDDQTRSMGHDGTGGRTAAPIWLEFMQAALDKAPVHDFELPEGISCLNIDSSTGKRAGEYTARPFLECFKEGTEPQEPQPVTVWSDEGEEEDGGEPGAAPDTLAPGEDPEAPPSYSPPPRPAQPGAGADAAPEPRGFRFFPKRN
ncbi:MAG: PBP1A family penicillin-binding protein [Deltaproteobacteria bacterium]|nr:PBP1A family penicillin-binding protein [Deltaproteobacteria bacterium]